MAGLDGRLGFDVGVDFAAAGLAHKEANAAHIAFFVSFAASVGAGISMGSAEALSDDGEMTGRGNPWMRGIVT